MIYAILVKHDKISDVKEEIKQRGGFIDKQIGPTVKLIDGIITRTVWAMMIDDPTDIDGIFEYAEAGNQSMWDYEFEGLM